MRAIQYSEPGTAKDVLKLVDVEKPAPGRGEVLVKISTSGVNPSDVKSRTVAWARNQPYAPIIPHSDGAGVIEAVGEGVDDARTGERVWVHNAQWQRGHGTACEYVSLPAEYAVPLPDNASFEVGACLGIPVMTAHHAITINGPVRDKWVLVPGAAGAVGHYAVQIAKLSGAQVIATVSTDEKAKHAEKAGADVVLNYKEDDLAREIMKATEGHGVDHVAEVDLSGNAQLYGEILAPNAFVAIYGMERPDVSFACAPLLPRQIGLKFFIIYMVDVPVLQDIKKDITTWLEHETLIHNIARTYPLEECAAAHDAVENRDFIGNVVLTV